MLGRRGRALLLALLTISSMVSLLDRAEAQGAGLKVSSDLELLGVGGLDGGGHVTWTLTGAAAQSLRQKIQMMFDGYDPIPRGFAYAYNVTGGNRNGRIESGEAQSYTNFLENEVEGARPVCCRGTDVRYVRIDRSDILEEGFPVERSVDGLVGVDPNSTERLEIRFIFNAGTVSENLRFRFSDVPLANALHGIFEMRHSQSPTATDPWPFRLEGGWHTVPMADGLQALWHGNDSTFSGDPLLGQYDNGSANATRTTTSAIAPYTDLRFASSANATFRYMGRTADANDRLRLQAAPGPSYTAWSDLTSVGGTVDLPAATGWTSVTYDLAAYVGREVQLRLNFTSDATGNAAPGFFIRGFTINGPSAYTGDIESASTDYLVGTLSFQEFDMRTGRAHLIRTPAGEVLTYGGTYNASAPPDDVARFRGFDFFENPQILFILLLFAGYLTSWFQDRLFYGYRDRHSAKYRSSAARNPWLVWTARVLIILYILFYFLPSMFVFFGASNAFISGVVYWIFAIGATTGLTLVTWLLYDRQAKFIPPEEGAAGVEAVAPAAGDELAPPPPPPEAEEAPFAARQRLLTCAHCQNEIEDPKDAYKCRCGQVYHATCAAEIQRCPNCQRALDIARPAERRMVTAKCPACGEIQVVPEGTDLMQTRCEACGALLKEIERGFNYLVIAPENDLALEWFQSIVRRSVPGLAMSTTFQDKLRKEFGLEDIDLYWLTDTDTGPKSIDPKRIDFEMMRTISNFIKRTKGGAVLLDGLEYLVVENSFDRVLKFIKKVNDLASVHEVTLIVPVTTGSVGPDEMTLLRKEFDRVIETSGHATPAAPKP